MCDQRKGTHADQQRLLEPKKCAQLVLTSDRDKEVTQSLDLNSMKHKKSSTQKIIEIFSQCVDNCAIMWEIRRHYVK